MNQAVIVMESGGTKTDVAAILNGKVQWVKTLDSLHPRRWAEIDWSEWSAKTLWPEVNERVALHFYGAGCNAPDRKRELTDHLLNLDYGHLSIHSDLEAAVHAFEKEQPKYIAILGTGSVLLVNDEQGWRHRGGLGFQEGDEGAGAHFGRMVIRRYKAGTLTDEQHQLVEEVKFEKHRADDIESAKQLAFQLGPNPAFLEIHRANIQAFIELTIAEEITHIETLYFVGGYAHHLSELLEEVFSTRGIRVGKVIAQPIHQLIQNFISTP